MKLGELGEFRWIDRLAAMFPAPLPRDGCGIGDDCAVLPAPGGCHRLVTTDLLVEGVHFRTAWTGPGDLGAKALAVSLSDIAAMGGTPEWAFVSMALPAETEVAWAEKFFRGFGNRAEGASVRLLGGDTTRSPGPIFVNVTVMGSALADHIKYRHTALAEDVLFVTGTLGDSAAGLELLRASPEPRKNPAEAALVRRHRRPRPHLEEGAWLGGRTEVHAMMDLSDGLDSDLRRILHRSRCGAVIDLETLPVSPELRRVAADRPWRTDELAAIGGEDYGLLSSVDPAEADRLESEFLRHFGRPIYRVGRITRLENHLEYRRHGRPCRPQTRGFEHFTVPNR